MEHNPTKIPSPLLSLVPILVLVTLLFVTIRIFGSDALSGGSQIVLLTATAICCLIAMTYSKVRWKALELAMINNITGVATALIILLIIGALSGQLDDKWCRPHFDLLRDADYPSQFLPGIYLHHLRIDFRHDRKFVDYHCYHRYRPDGYRKGARF